MEYNNELELAWEFVEHTGISIFLTGKAGTGKTTFLRTLRQKSAKTMVVVAPTGVAAINAGGVTIHSFFQLPLSPYIPGSSYRDKFSFSKEKLRIIRALDLLVIDEISMVRSDLLDAIDNALRKYRRSPLPFGGVQLLMIGDLQQLAPVVTPRDEAMLRGHYDSPYFFGSKALAQIPYVTLQLTRVFRQQNERFVEILNHVRDNRLTPADLQMLHSRVQPSFRPAAGSDYIRLTSHNSMADSYNAQQIAMLTTPARNYEAKVKGVFPETSYPTPLSLTLKVGAQVMFIKNDSTGAHRYYNGKIGHVTYADRDTVRVLCPGDTEEIVVEPEIWENARYTVNESTNTIDTEVQGTFAQLPLRLAWAITIHKSQGLTFDHVIIDAGASFAPGQVYVALSRCKTLEGIVLATPLDSVFLGCDPAVRSFISNQEEEAARSASELQQIKQAYVRHTLAELFNFRSLADMQHSLSRLLNSTYSHAFPEETVRQQQIELELREKIIDVADRWLTLINGATVAQLVEPQFLDRVKKGAEYFRDSLTAIFGDSLRRAARVRSDNKKASQRVRELTLDLSQSLSADCSLLDAVAQHGFTVSGYLKYKQSATLDATTEKSLKRVANGGRFTDPASSLAPKSAKNRAAKAPKEPRTYSHEVTYEMFRAGMTREEIARERSLAIGTITSHLMHYADKGELDPGDIFTPAVVNAVRSAMQSLPPDASSPQIAALLPDTIPLNDIVCIRSLLR